MNSHIRALRQHNDRILDNAPVSAALRWGFKTKKPKTQPMIVMPDSDPADFFKVLCFKNPLQRCRTKGMGTGAGGTLFERPNVRVRAAAVNMFFVREAEGRVAGRPFLKPCRL